MPPRQVREVTDNSRLRYEGDPTLVRVMLKPRWLASLLLALVVAGGFAWLGQWQLGHAIAEEPADANISEVVRPLNDLTAPGTSVTDVAAGMVTEIDGAFVAGDFRVVERRENGGEMGAWVVGHLETIDGGHLAVAIGWAPDADLAAAAMREIDSAHLGDGSALSFEGRYMPSDAAVTPAVGDDPFRITSMTAAQLVNVWAPFTGAAYPGFLVLHHDATVDATQLAAWGLDVIDSVAPLPQEKVNWLNVFYAAEWVIFAGFAVYLWYRLARDDWERTHELRLLEESEQEPADPLTHSSVLSSAGTSHSVGNE